MCVSKRVIPCPHIEYSYYKIAVINMEHREDFFVRPLEPNSYFKPTYNCSQDKSLYSYYSNTLPQLETVEKSTVCHKTEWVSSNLSSLKQSKRYQACFTLWIMNTVQSLIQLASSYSRLCIIVQKLVFSIFSGFFSLLPSEKIMDEKVGIPSTRMPCSWLLLVQHFSSKKL